MDDDRIYSAVALRLGCVALFSCMNLLIKLAEAGGATLGELLFFRQLGALVLITVVVAAGPGFATLRTRSDCRRICCAAQSGCSRWR